jgi:hypothetical protein
MPDRSPRKGDDDQSKYKRLNANASYVLILVFEKGDIESIMFGGRLLRWTSMYYLHQSQSHRLQFV